MRTMKKQTPIGSFQSSRSSEVSDLDVEVTMLAQTNSYRCLFVLLPCIIGCFAQSCSRAVGYVTLDFVFEEGYIRRLTPIISVRGLA